MSTTTTIGGGLKETEANRDRRDKTVDYTINN